MKKLLGLATIPAPYRVDVLCGLSEKYDIDVYFERLLDQNRNARYCGEGDGYTVLTTPELMQEYKNKIKNIRQYDMVLAHDYTSKMGMQLMLRCIFAGVPYCINCDGAFIYPHWLKDRIKSFFIKRATAFFASGQSAKEYLMNYGATEDKIFYHKFTATHRKDMPTECPTKEERQAYREQLGFAERKTVVSVGQFIHRKGFDVLLSAWKDMPEDCQLLLIGGGRERDNYLQQISEQGLQNVEILDFVDKEKIFDYYRASDLFVLPTREDVWGLVINEAMSCGLPVITTDMCVAGKELIEDDSQGYVIPIDDAHLLHEKMVEILADPERAVAMGRKNHAKIQDYVVENIVAGHLEVLEQLMGE